MARKRKTSPLKDILDLVSLLPWWAGVAIATVGYVVLNRMAVPVQVTAVQPGQVGGLVTASIVASLASVGQYVFPLICLAGAAASFFRRKERASLVEDVTQAKSANALDGMSWREFEMLVGEAYRLQGYRVMETGRAGPDGGVDLILTKGDEKSFVQCKQWKAYKVGVEVVRELYGVMAAKGAASGFVVTSGRFTDDAKSFVEGRNVELVDGPKLLAMIKQARQSLGVVAQKASDQSKTPQLASTNDPACPLCGSSMVKRTARKGTNAGSQFWGCAKYPSCRGVRPL